MSTPTGSAPRAAAAAATCPGPVATSSTRMPAPTRATSRSASTKRDVIAPVTRPYVLARRDHPAASNALNSSAPLAIAVTLSPRRPMLGKQVGPSGLPAASTAASNRSRPSYGHCRRGMNAALTTGGLVESASAPVGAPTRRQTPVATTLRRRAGRKGPAQELRSRRSNARGPRRRRWSPAGQGRCSGGWRRTRCQTELAEAEAVSDDRTRPPTTPGPPRKAPRLSRAPPRRILARSDAIRPPRSEGQGERYMPIAATGHRTASHRQG